MALPWNVNGVGTDARELALDAARRQGKSLGEWLNDVISDHAGTQGLAARQLGGRDRIEAVTSRLEQLGAEPAETNGRLRDRTAGAKRPIDLDGDDGHATGSFGDDPRDARRTGRSAQDKRSRARPVLVQDDPIDDDDDLLEDAVRALEQRAARTERRTGAALASVAKLLEDTQARREQEYGSVAALSRKLGELEATLSQRLSANAENPLKGSLARLEARLDAVARRGAAEAAARHSVADARSEAGDPGLRQLEDKLNTILAAVTPPRRAGAPGVSAAAISAVRAAQPDDRRGMGEAIAEIARRQRALESPVAPDAAVAPRSGEGSEGLLGSLRAEVAALVGKVDDIRRDAALSRATRLEPDAGLAELRADVAAVTRTLGELASRGTPDGLEHSLATLAERIEESRDRGLRETVLRPIEAAMGDLRHALHAQNPRDTIAGLEDELRRIADKVDGLRSGDGLGFDRLQRQMEDMRVVVTELAARPVATQRIEEQVAALAATLDRGLAERPADAFDGEAAAALTANGRATTAGFDAIGQRMDQLAERLDQVLASSTRTVPVVGDETRHLEDLVQELALRFEAAQVPGDGAALDALQRQIEQLSTRFERSEGELAALPDLAASMRVLFDALETTRASVETTAARAAREVLKIAVEDGGARAGVAEDPRAATREAETSARLDTVHAMLGKVVDRLGSMEREIADNRRPVEPRAAAPVPVPHPVRVRSSQAAKGATDEIRLGGAEPRPEAAHARAMPIPAFGPGERLRSVPTDEARRSSDYIAAARRAAAAAQAEAAAAQRQMPSARATRAGLLARSRDYVATHKRPMLMGLAAIIMALGAMALAGRIGDGAGGPQVASRQDQSRIAVATRVAPMADARTVTAALDSGALAPSAMAKPAAAVAATIPGSDPIQTGSLPSLPAFAAGASMAPRPSLPRGLVAAAENGDAAAQYDLATRYAEGRFVPRDMKRAAGLFEKAANSGLAPAEYRLAALYEKGVGVPLDKTRAKALYAKAADLGNPRAMHNLAVLLADNDGQPDYPAAIGWFRKAAQYGVHDSQYNLAVLLGKGLGAPQNLVQSYQWFAVAAAANDADAEKKREEVGQKLSANDLGVAKALAASFSPKVPASAAVDVAPPPGGWDGAPGSSRLNSARSKISSL